MDKFGKSQPVKRVEDVRLLTGAGQYTDDTVPKGALYAWFVRSDMAHGTITGLDTSEAASAPGVALVVTQEDMEAAGIKATMDYTRIKNRDGSDGAGPERTVLAKGRVRHVGQALALIVAESRDQARDAAEMIWAEIDELPASLALAPGGEELYPEEAPENRVFDWHLGDEAKTEAAFAAAAHHVSLEVGDNRIIACAMEPRTSWAEFDGQRLHLSFAGQGVWGAKGALSAMFGMEPEDVRVTNGDVGGGFGMKAFLYPEYFAICHAARVLGRPVRWAADRGESMLTDNAGRDLVTQAELALDADLKITGYRLHSACNMGAACSAFAQAIQTQLFSRVVTGVYDIPAMYIRAEGFFTNTAPVDAYRGAGRPEAIYVMERVMDRAARELGVDGLELRRRNFIPSGAFPYATLMGETYDVGDFHKVQARAEIEADLAGLPARRAADAAAGRYRGVGFCYYIESILGDPSETAAVEFNEDGTVTIFVGTQSNGQGHETVFTRFLADQTGIPAEKIQFVQGDSDRIKQGGGTGGSRSVTTQNTAILATTGAMITAFTDFLADETGAPAAEIEFDDESFRIPGSNLTPTMLDVAEMARAAGREDLLRHSERTTLEARSFPNGCHVAEVVVDPETGQVTLDRYTVVDDFGNLINPMLAEGQVHGGVVQGVGQALSEHVVHDEDGQLLTASFMDYAVPRASDVPMMRFVSEPVPSTANTMGMKGCGEAGTVGSMAATANAVQDALWDVGVRQADMPFTPHRVWEMLRDVQVAAE